MGGGEPGCMAQISLRVNDEKKEEWQQAVENSDEYDSLTHLIELAVHHEMDDRWILLSRVNAFAEGVDFDTSAITSSIDDVFDEVRGMRSQMDQIEAVAEVMQSEKLREIALAANDVLPTIENEAELAEKGRAESGHPEDIHAAVSDEFEDISRADIQLALDFLVYQYNNVYSGEVGGEQRYYEVSLS